MASKLFLGVSLLDRFCGQMGCSKCACAVITHAIYVYYDLLMIQWLQSLLFLTSLIYCSAQ